MTRIILGSQSPRRRELLEQITTADQLSLLPPKTADEPGFDGLSAIPQIEDQLRHIVRLKRDDVISQLPGRTIERDMCVVCADTIVVAGDADAPVVLGKPDGHDWQNTVRTWFRNYYSGRSHEVWTCCRLETHDQSSEPLVKTAVTMSEISDSLIDWYLSTEESQGKAGGYGIQGKAALFVDGITGSLTNVIGLPMREVVQSLSELSVSFG